MRTLIEVGSFGSTFPECMGGFLRLHAIYRTDTPPGPAAAWRISRFETQAKVMAKFSDEHAALVSLQGRRKKISGGEMTKGAAIVSGRA
jgi:hypothetical protein